MFDRDLELHLAKISDNYKIITIMGPRQSGKSTLAKKFYTSYDYCSLEDPDNKDRAVNDPKGFLQSKKENTILDEIQRVPDLLSYLQTIVDDKSDNRKWVLTGSNSLLMSEKISQSLAGRSRIITCLPLSFNEIPKKLKSTELDQNIFTGGYPRIYDENLQANIWCSDYIQTYIEKDLRQMLNIVDLSVFEKFLSLLAGRVGNLLNFSSFTNDVGVSHSTASSWLSVLEASYITFRLPPHFKNFSKRIIKSPKCYFWDTGLLCSLLRINNFDQLFTHPLKGAIFENWVISEYSKKYYNLGLRPPLYFWRDQSGHEIDIVIDKSTHLYPIEIKSSSTFNPNFIKNINWFNDLQEFSQGEVIYGGTDSYEFKGVNIKSWNSI